MSNKKEKDTNSGYSNSGHRNSGDSNSGHYNSGDCNSGNRNSGNSNSGDCNSGNSNSGHRNSGDFHRGIFNIEDAPIFVFGTQVSIKERDEILSVFPKIEVTIWVSFDNMSKEEKDLYPDALTNNGYLKNVSIHEAWSIAWNKLTLKAKLNCCSVPHFNEAIFLNITGLDVTPLLIEHHLLGV